MLCVVSADARRLKNNITINWRATPRDVTIHKTRMPPTGIGCLVAKIG